MAKPSWRWEADAAGVALRLLEKPLLGRARPVSFTDWATREPKSTAAIARLGRLLDEGEGGAEPIEGGVRLSHDALADLDEAMARSLGLPPAPPFLLRLVPRGLITDPDFAVDARFVGLGDVPLRPEPTREGAILRQGSSAYRLPRQLLDILDASATLAAMDGREPTARMAALARLKTLLPDAAERWVQPDGYLRTLRVAVPGAFSLRLSTKGGRFDLDPVLFGREVAEAAEGGAAPDEGKALLTSAEDEAFRRRFREEKAVPGAYPLGRGTYLFLPDGLRSALQVVRETQDAPPAERETLARTPQRFLAERLAGRLDSALIETLFVETEQYSERVLGLGLWQPPVLPWLQRAPNSWLPERFGLRVGDRTVEIPPDRLDEAEKAVRAAMEAGEPTANVPGVGPIPATRQTLEAIGELRKLHPPREPEEDDEGGEPKPGPGPELTARHVLLTKDNLEEVGFHRTLTPRRLTLLDQPPRALASALKAHQKDGLRWLQQCWRAGEPGVLLADDMGLGKTVQALAFLAWLREAGVGGPILVVAPTGLLANWRAEEEKHLARPGLGELAAAYGAELRQLRLVKEESAQRADAELDLDRLRRAGWILTTYETLRDHELSFGKLRLACVVLDELQKAKNPAALIHKAVTALNADFALGLTGTPVENRIEDLWAVMEPLQPGELGDLKSFAQRHPPTNLEALEALRTRLLDDPPEGPRAPMLRRLKADVLDGLPEKHVHRRPAPMPPAQAETYAELVAQARAGRLNGLEALHHLRGVSLHPEGAAGGRGDDEWIAGAARLSGAMEGLEEVEKRGEKALLFCENLDVQERLADLVHRRFRLPRRPAQITGEVAGPKRQEAVNRFQAPGRGFDVMLLTPRAGGVGLTLTAANHVVHLSRWWNPAVEDQCTDRVFRIGQDKPVHVWYPMALHPSFPGGSFDEALDALLERKRELTRRLLVPPVGPGDEAELLKATLGG